jgi:molecular chaperone DnaK (HSP70)
MKWSQTGRRGGFLLVLLVVCVESFAPIFLHRRHASRFAALHASEPVGVGVGIDLGTTHSAVSILKDGVPIILEIAENGRTMPSVVHVVDDELILVGKPAIDREVEHPLGTYRNVKRVIGSGDRAARDIANVVPNLVIRDLPEVKVKRNKKGKKKKEKKPGLMKQILDAQENPAQLYLPPDDDGVRATASPEFISAQVLKKLFDTATAYTGQPVDRAVVGVPAYFHDEQRDATIRACQLAGVEKVRLLREPEAAALSYGVGKEQIGQGDTDELVLVFDLGGGTYDVSMLVVGGGLTEVISTSGDVALGGSDFDYRIAQYFNKLLMQNGAKKLLSISEAADSMVRAAEAVRIYLSNNRRAQLSLPLSEEGWTTLENARDVILLDDEQREDLTEEGVVEENHLVLELSRRTMEGLCTDELQRLLRPLREVAIMSGALLPGDARPSVVEAALEFEEEIERAMKEEAGFEDFYDSQEKMGNAVNDIDPDMVLQLQSVDMKEAKKAQQRGRKKARTVAKEEKKFRAEKRKVDASVPDVKVRDGINGRPISQVVLVGGATRMPAIGRLLAALTGVVPQRTVNPDEAVALGCAVQVGVLDGDENLGGLTVLTPMQAAIMRAVAEQQGLMDDDPDFADFGDDPDFDDPDFEGGDFEVVEF